jgi:cytochrome c biogenesis protein CcmG, thiol:disulfide interchange protein DsbE
VRLTPGSAAKHACEPGNSEEDARAGFSLLAISSGSHTNEPNVRIVITDVADLRFSLRIPLLAAALAAIAVTGCGGAEEGSFDGSHPNYAKALAGSPAPLARVHAQGNRLLPGGLEAYEERIAELRGFPVVVNLWASWCGGCRLEFPAFQQAAARYGKRVAFLGVDSEDSEDAAATFLDGVPVPYPSYSDPEAEIKEGVGGPRGLPDTAFYDRAGELVFLHQGAYEDEADLYEDIELYALGKPVAKGG